MSTSIVDLKTLHDAYTRLTEKFKTFWTFHQFLQGVHKTFFGDAPGYQIDFQGLYDQIKSVTTILNVQPPPVVMDQINQLDGRLDVVYRALSADDEKIAASWVRRFFEKVRTEDEKLLLAILRFYFHSRQVSPEAIDKMDFLVTLVGARRSLDDGRYLPRFPQELTKLFAGLLGLVRRSPAPAAELTAAVKALGLIRQDIDGCDRFEDLTEKKILDSLRTVKHRLGPAYYDTNVLSAILEANLAAKNRFQTLYRNEEKRIFESSQQLLDIERELSRRPEVADADLQEEFRRFRQFKEEFDKNRNEGEIRHGQVTRLAEAIDQLMARLDATSETAGEVLPEVLPVIEEEELAEARETISGFFPGRDAVAPPPSRRGRSGRSRRSSRTASSRSTPRRSSTRSTCSGAGRGRGRPPMALRCRGSVSSRGKCGPPAGSRRRSPIRARRTPPTTTSTSKGRPCASWWMTSRRV